MSAAITWILVVVSSGFYNQGTLTVVGKFENFEQCQSVRLDIQAMPMNKTESRCIQAKGMK